jgi:hypothetical protein
MKSVTFKRDLGILRLKGVNIMPEKQNAQRTNVNKEELSIEQRKHKEQNEHRRFEEMSNKKLDGPNRPAE